MAAWTQDQEVRCEVALRRVGDTFREAREHLRELPAPTLYALAARERLPLTARLVQRLADDRVGA